MNDFKITVDYSEAAYGLSDLLKDSGALVEIEKLSYGDYIINDMITIERKTAKDFLVSIIDGRLFSQLSNLKKFCNHPILLIEGNPYKTAHNFDRMAIKGALISTQTNMVCTRYFFSNKRRFTGYFINDKQTGWCMY